MATLEKIRSKQKLLFIVIIVALLAFILGDFLTSGYLSGDHTTVAKAGGAKVEYNDFSNYINNLSQRDNRQNGDVLAQQAINDLLAEQLMKQEYEDLGLVVTDQELSDAIFGANPHPVAAQYIAQLSQMINLQEPNANAVYDAISNPAKYGLPAQAGPQIQQYWVMMEENLEQTILAEQFNKLYTGLFTANELDAKNLYNDVANTRNISYAVVNLNTVKDEEVQVTDKDRQDAWNENKYQFRITEPMRSIDYIAVRIEPSQADRLAGQQAVENALAALNSTEGTEGVASDARFNVQRGTTTYSQITDKDIKAFLDSAEVGNAVITKFANDKYTMVKLLERSTGIDSINVSEAYRADRGNLDDVLARVNAGAPFADILAEDSIQGRDSIWNSLVGANIPENLKDALTNRTVGEAFVLTDTINNEPVNVLYRINSRHAPVDAYEIAIIEFTVDPSVETITTLSNNLNTYVSNHSTAATFAEGAAEAGYTILKGMVSASTPMIGNDCSDCRSAIKWAMEANQGQVMPVFQDNKQTYLLTLAVTGIYEEDYLPWNCPLIADNINNIALNNVKARKLIDQYSGKADSVEGYAKAMGVEAQSGEAIFNAPMLATIGFGESKLQGQVAAAKLNTVVGPVKANNSVVVFTVTGEETKGREYSFDEYATQFKGNLNIGNANVLGNSTFVVDLLRGDSKIENRSLNFVSTFGE